MDFNNTKRTYPIKKHFHNLFEEQAESSPDAIAVALGDQRLSYGELNARANQLAHRLRALGVGPETLVAICVERSLEMVIGILGILKAGSAYLPLDPVYPKDRLAFMLEDANPSVLLTQEHLVSNLPTHASQVVSFNGDRSALSEWSEKNLQAQTVTKHLAYVIYTSGSTGRPKGVMITHGNLSHYLQSVRVPMGISFNDRYLHTASISFSSSVRQLMVPLSQGATIVIAISDKIKDPVALFELVRRNGVTIMDIVPSYWRSCITALISLPLEMRKTLLDNQVRLIMSASEPLLSDIPNDWSHKLHHGARLVNMFGQTETTGIVTTYEIPTEKRDQNKIIPIGSPIRNTQIHLLDPQLRPVENGEPGEIYIGSPGVGHGYLNLPELTKERFIPDPFCPVVGARLYKTGDIGRRRPDGVIEFLGRLDNQVKIRGHRVELEEIEVVLREHSNVHDAAAIATEEHTGDTRIIAYVVPDRACAPSINGRERYRLPNNMAILQQNQHETDFFYQQIFVDQTNFRHGIILRDGDCVFDVGANIGLFTMFVQQVRNHVSVYAFEPIPAIFETLSANVSLYGKNSKLFQCGLSNESKEVVFTYYPGSSTQSGRYAEAQEDRETLKTIISNQQIANSPEWEQYVGELVNKRIDGSSIVCQLRTLSEFIREQDIERIDLLKIDAEKSELDVLMGIEENDWRKIRQIVIEAYEAQLEPMTALLEQHGFTTWVEADKYIEGSGLFNLYATRLASGGLQSNHRSDSELFSVPVLTETILQTDELRQYLQARLPEYMMPSAFVILDALPRTPNGKVDRLALPTPDRESPGMDIDFAAPRTPIEKQLADVWAGILKLKRIGIHYNFFEMGGDSILCIQACARASKAGLRFTPMQLFNHPTIAELAAVVGTEQTGQAEQGLVLGSVALTPIQHWFFEQDLTEPHCFNQAVLLEARRPLDSSLLEQAVKHLMAHHDSLRLRYSRQQSTWQQDIVGLNATVPVSRVDLSGLPEAEQGPAMAAAVSDLQGSLNLSQGPLLRVALFEFGAGRPSRLLMTIHHLAVDGVSWRILLEDLQTAYQQLTGGEAISLPPKTTSFKQWSQRLNEYAQLSAPQSELSYWLAESRSRVSHLPVDNPGGPNTYALASTVSVSLSVTETSALLQEVPLAYHTQINDVLLTALVDTFGRWTGERALLVDLEGHGREEIIEGVDLSRTVGWFTTLFPVLLDTQDSAGLSEAVRSIKDQLGRIPNKGIGYGVLRYLSRDEKVKERLRLLPQSGVRFNYLGQFDQSLTESSPFDWVVDVPGPNNVLRGPRRYLIEIDALVAGSRQLQLFWTYSESCHRRSTIEGLACAFLEALRVLITTCQSSHGRASLSSDLLKAKLGPKDFAKFMTKVNQPRGEPGN